MNLNPRHLFLFGILLLLASSHSLFGQTLLYDIYKGDDVIGEIKVEKVKTGDKVHYEANSASSFRVLFLNELSTHTSSAYVNDVLEYAKSKIILNDKVKQHSIIKREGEFYRFYQHPDEPTKKKVPPFPISTTALYYMEPVGLDHILSENYQALCPLKVIGSNAYELTLPDGKVNQYFYKEGALLEVKVIRTFVDLSFRLKERS